MTSRRACSVVGLLIIINAFLCLAILVAPLHADGTVYSAWGYKNIGDGAFVQGFGPGYRCYTQYTCLSGTNCWDENGNCPAPYNNVYDNLRNETTTTYGNVCAPDETYPMGMCQTMSWVVCGRGAAYLPQFGSRCMDLQCWWYAYATPNFPFTTVCVNP
jgi:hypothetical protein